MESEEFDNIIQIIVLRVLIYLLNHQQIQY